MHPTATRTLARTIGLLSLLPLTQVHGAPMLEEVIVTAQKREESLQDVPISIAAFTQDALEKMGVHDIKGLAAKVPNVVVNEFTGSSTTIRLFIRGVGQNDVQVTQDPSVALYMDGVYIGSSVGTAFESADIARIEVLRGPQGTLYGRNATGGAINLITNKADPEALHFKQRLTVGNYNRFRSRTIANVPLSSTTALKLAYSHSERDGIVSNLGRGEDFGIEDRSNITADFRWDASDRVTLDYKFERSTIEDTARLSQTLGFDPSAAGAAFIGFANPALKADGSPVDTDKHRLDEATSYDEVQIGDVEINGHTLNIGWNIGADLTFRSITGHRDVDAFTQNAQAPTTFLNLGPGYTIVNGLPETDFEQFSQELQLLGAHEQVNWVAGLYYYEDESFEQNLGHSGGSEGIPAGVLRDVTTTENTSIALFGQATWTPAALGNRWHFTLGARYSDDNRKAYRDNNRVSFGLGGAATTVPAFTAYYDKDFDEFNPAFTAEFDLNEHANIYAKVVSAYKSGGTSQRSTTASNFENGFEPEDLLSYEVGFKGDLWPGRLRFNAAVFYMQYEGYQQSVQTGRNAGERDFVNIEDADITGLEFDLTFAVSENLTATLSYGYLDAAFDTETIVYELIDDTSATGLATIEEMLTDKLALAPDHTITTSFDYSHPLPFGRLNANVNLQWQDEANGGVQFPSAALNDRTLVAATLSVSDMQLGEMGRLRVSLWGNNLLDEEYHVGNIRQTTFDSLGFTSGLATFGDPRSYGVTLEYEFD